MPAAHVSEFLNVYFNCAGRDALIASCVRIIAIAERAWVFCSLIPIIQSECH